MAEPWVLGSEQSTLYGAKNCHVSNEDIFIKLTNKDDFYFTKYKIKYSIYSDVDQTVPLLFIGIGLSERKLVTVNNSITQIKKYNSKNAAEISYSKDDVLPVNEDDLIYFDAKLIKGINTIYIEYDSYLEHNNQGFIRTYKLNYSLYPSKFWASFGTINIELFLGENLKITSSNIGEPRLEKGIAYFTINTIDKDKIELEITKKTNVISGLLIIMQPFGIATLFLVFMFAYHRKLLIENYKQKKLKQKSILFLGILIMPLMYYLVFFLSYPLIDFSLGQKNSKHGYIFLYIFTLPVVMLIYGLLMWIINHKLKLKYVK